jgi:hypothetical protein
LPQRPTQDCGFGNTTGNNLRVSRFVGALSPPDNSVVLDHAKAIPAPLIEDHNMTNKTNECPACRGTGNDQYMQARRFGEKLNPVACNECGGTGQRKPKSAPSTPGH